MTHTAGTQVLGLQVANLPLWLDARGTPVRMAAPEPYRAFLLPGSAEGGLVLRLRDGRLRSTSGWSPLYSHPETWQIWQDGAGCLLIVPPGHPLPDRGVWLAAGFSHGEVLGDLAGCRDGGPLFPLEDVDMVLYANWLAGSGDLILHAACVEIDGRGYCFAGGRGAGKSTLATHLAERIPGSLLAEDNAVLRFLGGRFWIFGTPWHEIPARCSPAGAPLEKVFFLDRQAAHGVRAVRPVDAIASLLQTAFVPYYRAEAVPAILDHLALLAGRVPFYSLSYQVGEDVMQLIHST